MPGIHQGRVSRALHASKILDVAISGEGSTQKRKHPSTSYMRGEPNTGTVAAFSPALTLKPQHSDSPCMSLAPPKHSLSNGTQSECLLVSESVHRAFKWTHGFPAIFCLTGMNGIHTDFHSQMLWRLLFPTLVLQAEDHSVGLRPLTFQRGLLQLRYPF